MIAVSAQTRVLVCIGPIDFRKGIDGLAASCREILSGDPFSVYTRVLETWVGGKRVFQAGG